MSKNIMVSVICLAYNHELYIRDCLEGFVTQKTNFQFEVLINDDASTDRTADIIREYEAKYPDIIKPIYQTENQFSRGVKISSDILYPKAKGEYIAWCEGDDYWCDETKLQKQFDFMRQNPDYSGCVHNVMKLDCVKQSQVPMSVQQNDCNLEMEDIVFNRTRYFQTSALFLRKQYFAYPDSFRNPLFSDYQIELNMAINGKIRYISDVMSVYRFRSVGSWSETLIHADKEKRQNYCQTHIQLSEVVDEYTDYQYHDIFLKEIDEFKCELLELNQEYLKILKNKNYRNIFLKKYDKKTILHFLIKTYFPHLFDFCFKRKGNTQNEQ